MWTEFYQKVERQKLDEALKEELTSFPGKYQLPEKASESLLVSLTKD